MILDMSGPECTTRCDMCNQLRSDWLIEPHDVLAFGTERRTYYVCVDCEQHFNPCGCGNTTQCEDHAA